MINKLLLAAILAAAPACGRMSTNVLTDATYSYSFPAGGYEVNERDCWRMNNIWTAPSYNKYDYNALEGAEYYDIDFALKQTAGIYAVEADCLKSDSWGIHLPKAMEIYASVAGGEFKLIGRVDVQDSENPFTKKLVRFDARKEFDADVLKVRIYSRRDKTCMDEIRAFAYDPDGHILPGEHTDETTDAYGTPLITHFLKMDYNTVCRNTPAKDVFKMLSDGNKQDYVRFFRGGGRHLVWDLKKAKAVGGFNATFYRDPSAAVYIPPVLAVSVSNDAENWTTVSAELTGQYLPDMPKVNPAGVWYDEGPASSWEYSVSFVPVEARYVRLSFEVDRVYTAAKEVCISEAGPVICPRGTVASSQFVQTESPFGHYPSVEQAGFNACFYASVRPLGIKDGERRQLTDEQAMRMFVHGDQPFFDAVCFTTFGFGSSVGEMLDTYFDDRYNLASVERAMDHLCAVSGKDYKVGVWYALKNVNTAAEDFDIFLARFAAAGFKHLYVLGSYWEPEDDNYDRQDGLRAVNAHVHSLGYRTFWCPYYGQAAIWRWKDYGFDVACLQPNIMFHGHAADDLYMTCEVARLCGMSVESEIDSPENDVVCSLFAEYFRSQAESGAAESCKVFYIGGSPNALIQGADSGLPYASSLLEDTYKFVSGQ